MKKVTILALHLGYGGIENTVAALSNSLADNYEVDIISVYKLYDKPVFPINKKVKIKYLFNTNLPLRINKYKNLLKSYKIKDIFTSFKEDYINSKNNIFNDLINTIKIYKTKDKLLINEIKNNTSDVIISTRDSHNYLLSEYGNKLSLKVGWEHNHHNNNKKYINNLVSSVKNLDKFVLISNELYNYYNNLLKNEKVKCLYIPNFIEEIPKNKSKLNTNNIITVGRLSKEKGHADLIKVISLLNEKIEDFHLNIIGDGPTKKNIQNLIKKYNLENKISLLGFLPKEEVYKYLEKSTVFLLPSLTESFGLVVLESFSKGVPVITFSSAKGAYELIDNEVNGIICKYRDLDKMSRKTYDLLINKDKTKKMGEKASDKAKLFTKENVIKKWTDLIEK